MSQKTSHGLPIVDASEVGMSAERLMNLNKHFKKYVDEDLLSGWAVTVAREGKVAHSASGGLADRESSKPIADDTIYRIFSMTKPITAVAALMLWEEGLFELTDPVSKFIPEFGESKVFEGGSFLRPVLGPQTKAMEMWHLFTHTAGLTYGFMYQHPVDELYRRAGMEWGFPRELDLAGVCSLLARQPLLFQPGSEWNYSTSIDVLGRVVEVISGQRLGDFLKQRIFTPLGMSDTAFYCPDEKQDRLAALYSAHAKTRLATRADAVDRGTHKMPAADGGGGGLVSTMGDYVRFAEMLRGGGEFNGQRLLSSRTVDYMGSTHLPEDADLTSFGRPLGAANDYDGIGFGLGVSVTIDPVATKTAGSFGDFGWGGAAATFYWVDPVEDLTVTFMTQLMMSPHTFSRQLKQLVHQALVD